MRSASIGARTPNDTATDSLLLTQKRRNGTTLNHFVRLVLNGQGNGLGDHFPGVFSSANNDSEVPMCEFITLRTTKPFPNLDSGATPGLRYLDVIGLAADWEAWRHSQVPGLRFSIQQPPRTTPQNYSTLSICEEDCPQDVLNYGGHQGKMAVINYMDRFMPSLVSMWSVLHLLEVYTEQTGKILNSTEFRMGTRNDSVKTLRPIARTPFVPQRPRSCFGRPCFTKRSCWQGISVSCAFQALQTRP